LKFLAKKGCFLRFEWEKINFTAFGTPGKNSLVSPWKKSFRRPCLPQLNGKLIKPQCDNLKNMWKFVIEVPTRFLALAQGYQTGVHLPI